MSKFLNKVGDRRTRLRKIAADGKGFDFGKFLQDRNVRTGIAGLGTAGLAKLFGAGWGTSALLGLGAGAAAHYGQKAYDKWDAQRRYDALSHADKMKLEKDKQNKLYTDANVATEANKEQVAAKQEADRQKQELDSARAETDKIRSMTPEQRLAYRKQLDEYRARQEAARLEEEKNLGAAHAAYVRQVYGPELARLQAELARRQEKKRREDVGYFDYKFGDWPHGVGQWLGINKLIENHRAKKAEEEQYNKETVAMQKRIEELTKILNQHKQ